MPLLNKRWQIQPPLPPEVERDLQPYHPILRKLLYNRGIAAPEAAAAFLEPQPVRHLPPMLGMLAAVERLERAVQTGEHIAVYGDYDVDGVTATALLVQVLQALGANVRGYIPNRFEEGYGLNNEALETLCLEGVRVVVTVDCGIRSPREADFARSHNLDLIITDHHQPEAVLPGAYAIINPTQPGDAYPYKSLAGVGLAYKLAEALVERFAEQGAAIKEGFALENLLDLVALGTVADLAPLTGENRYLVQKGLQVMRSCQRQGLLSLINGSGLKQARVSAGDIGYILGPRLNAAGRLESALASLTLLTTVDFHEAGLLAQQLDDQNRERQRITQEIQKMAEEIALQEDDEGMLLFAAHPEFNPGVVGLAASRLSEVYYRPAVVAWKGEEHTRASCRSIPEFHITEALDQCADLLVRHGGHAAAAGFTVSNENLPELVRRLRAIAKEKLSGEDLSPKLVADLEVPLCKLPPDVLGLIEGLQPCGYGNRQAVFVSRDVEVARFKTVGKDSAHLKLTLKDNGIVYDAIAFRQGQWADHMPRRLDVMYNVELNEFNGRSSIQLNVRDLKAAGEPD
jgi:single-stranded-DNA-specific exonuclease